MSDRHTPRKRMEAVHRQATHNDEHVAITLTHCGKPLARILWVDDRLAVDIEPRGQLVDGEPDQNLNVRCTPPCRYDGIFNMARLEKLMTGVRGQGLTRLVVDAGDVERTI